MRRGVDWTGISTTIDVLRVVFLLLEEKDWYIGLVYEVKAFLKLVCLDFIIHLLVVLTRSKKYNMFAIIPISANYTK